MSRINTLLRNVGKSLRKKPSGELRARAGGPAPAGPPARAGPVRAALQASRSLLETSRGPRPAGQREERRVAGLRREWWRVRCVLLLHFAGPLPVAGRRPRGTERIHQPGRRPAGPPARPVHSSRPRSAGEL